MLVNIGITGAILEDSLFERQVSHVNTRARVDRFEGLVVSSFPLSCFFFHSK